MKFLLTVYIFFISIYSLYAQVVTVLNSKNGDPIEMATISEKKSEVIKVTNKNGQTDISDLKDSDSLYIRHLSFLEQVTTYEQLRSMNFLVELTENHFKLKEVVILSDRWKEKRLEVPNRIESIKIKDVAFQNPQTTADLLGISGYAYIQKSQLGGGSPMLRGFATNRVLLDVDGVRMNTAIFRSGNVQNVISLDANAVEETKILFGPMSVLYGSDAIGGVMTFKTLKPKFLDSIHKKVYTTGNAFIRTSSANSERTGHINFNVGLKNLAFLTSVTYADYDDLRSGNVGGDRYFYRTHYVQTIDNKDYMVKNIDSTLQIGSEYSQLNFMQKILFKPTNNWELDYGFHFSETSKYNRYDRLYVMQTSGPYKNKYRWAEWYYGPQKWQMHRVGITNLHKNKFYEKSRLIMAYQFFEESRHDREFMHREKKSQIEQVDAYSVTLEFDKSLYNKKIDIIYGTEAVYNQVNSKSSLKHIITGEITPTVTRYPDGSTWELYSIYTHADYKLSEKIKTSAGVRYSNYIIKAKFDTSIFPFPFTTTYMTNDALSGSLGTIYTIDTTCQIYLNGATGFRAPNIDDAAKVFESTPGYLVVPNPKLKPEKVYNAEIGFVKRFKSLIRFDLAAYYTILKDGMVRRNFTFNGDSTIRYLGNKSRIQAIQNVSEIRVHGLQAGIEFFYKGIGLKSNISFQDGKEQSDSLVFYPLRHAAPTFGSAHLFYEHRKFRMEFYVVYNAKMDYEDLALTERLNLSYARDENGKPYVAAWHTFNFKSSVNFNQYTTLTFGIENITNVLYRPYSSGINAPGRNFIISLRTRF